MPALINQERRKETPKTVTTDTYRGPPPGRSDWTPPTETAPAKRDPPATKPPRLHPMYKHTNDIPAVDPLSHQTISTVYVHQIPRPAPDETWTTQLKRAFNQASADHLPINDKITLENITWPPHYLNTIYLRVIHRPGFKSTDLGQALTSLQHKSKIFGAQNGTVGVGQTFTDIIVTFPFNTPGTLRHNRG